MKKLIWLALLLPTMAIANPATEQTNKGIKGELETQTTILTQIETNTASGGGDELGPVPAECVGAGFGLIAGVPVYPDGKYFYSSIFVSQIGNTGAYSSTVYSLANTKTISFSTGGLKIIREALNGLKVNIAAEFSDEATLRACFYGLIDAGRI